MYVRIVASQPVTTLVADKETKMALDRIRINAALYRIESGMALLDDDAAVLAAAFRKLEDRKAETDHAFDDVVKCLRRLKPADRIPSN